MTNKKSLQNCARTAQDVLTLVDHINTHPALAKSLKSLAPDALASLHIIYGDILSAATQNSMNGYLIPGKPIPYEQWLDSKRADTGVTRGDWETNAATTIIDTLLPAQTALETIAKAVDFNVGDGVYTKTPSLVAKEIANIKKAELGHTRDPGAYRENSFAKAARKPRHTSLTPEEIEGIINAVTPQIAKLAKWHFSNKLTREYIESYIALKEGKMTKEKFAKADGVLEYDHMSRLTRIFDDGSPIGIKDELRKAKAIMDNAIGCIRGKIAIG